MCWTNGSRTEGENRVSEERSTLVRFADDALMAFDNIVDAKTRAVSPGQASRTVRTHPPPRQDAPSLTSAQRDHRGARHPETDGDHLRLPWPNPCLGTVRGTVRDMVRQVTAKSRFGPRSGRGQRLVSEKNRHWSLRDQHRHLSSMMRGHFAYYGVWR